MVKKITVEVDVNNKKLEEVRKFVRSLEDGVTQVNIKLRDTARKTSEETKKLTNEYENLRTRGFNKIEDSTSNIFDNMERMKAAAEAYHDEIRDTIKEVEDLREMLVLANEEERKELEADIKVRERYLRELKKGARYASGEARRAAEKTAKKEIGGIPETPEEGGLKELMKRWAESLKMTIKGEKEKDSLYNKYRKTLTGVLIDLHILRILGQNSRVVNETFVKMGSVLGALLDVILIPMVQPMVSLMRAVAQLAGYITRMNPLLRTLLSTIFMFIVSLVASLTLIRTGKGMIDWFRGGSKPKQRAAGGPLQPGQSAIVGEKGAELLVPSAGGGFNVIPNNQLRFLQEGTDTDLLSNLTGGLLELTSGLPSATGGAVGGVMKNKSVQNVLGSLNIIGSSVGAAIAPIAGAIGILSGVGAGIASLVKINKSGFQGLSETVVRSGQAIRNVLTTLLLASLKWLPALLAAVLGLMLPGAGVAAGEGVFGDLFGKISKSLVDGFKKILERAKSVFEKAAEKIRRAFDRIAKFADKLKDGFDKIRGVIDRLRSPLKTFGEWLKEKFGSKDIFKGEAEYWSELIKRAKKMGRPKGVMLEAGVSRLDDIRETGKKVKPPAPEGGYFGDLFKQFKEGGGFAEQLGGVGKYFGGIIAGGILTAIIDTLLEGFKPEQFIKMLGIGALATAIIEAVIAGLAAIGHALLATALVALFEVAFAAVLSYIAALFAIDVFNAIKQAMEEGWDFSKIEWEQKFLEQIYNDNVGGKVGEFFSNLGHNAGMWFIDNLGTTIAGVRDLVWAILTGDKDALNTAKAIAENRPVAYKPIPGFQSGGVMPHDGLAYLHKDETVIPANAAPQVKIDINIAGSVDNRTIDELTRRLKLELTRVRM